MYKFITVAGSCGSALSIQKTESAANEMAAQGYELVEAFQTTTAGCGGANSAILMVFKQSGA